MVKMVSPNKNLIMKKLTLLTLSAFLMLSVIPGQIKAATNAEAAKTATISNETVKSTDQINEIKSIDLTVLSSSENKEALKEASPLKNEQGRHNGRYNNRHGHRDVDVTIRADRQVRGDGYVGRHNHGGAYIGGGGVLVLIIILILIL
jgi:hypothetical protein